MSGAQNEAAMAARIAQLEKELRDARDDFELAAMFPIADSVIANEVRTLGDRHGFGNVMATASALWRENLGNLAGAEFVAGPCRVTVVKRIEKISAVLRAGQ